MKIKLNTPLKDLSGEPIADGGKNFTFGQALASIVSASDTGGKMKLYVLATKLFNEKDIDVDEADLSLIKNAVASTKVYANALITGQCELLLEDVKESK